MILDQHRNTCENCQKDFKAPYLWTTYGEFLFRTLEDELGYQTALDDPVFDDFKRIYDMFKLSLPYVGEQF